MIIYIVAQNKLYSELELDLIFKSVIKIIVISIIKGILKFSLPTKLKAFMQKAKNLLNNEKSLIINRII
jgi:hypothetical protein